MSNTDNQKSARMSRRIGLVGGLIVMIGAAWASFAVRGTAISWVLAPAAFMALCHIAGCELFVRHFRSLDETDSDDG